MGLRRPRAHPTTGATRLRMHRACPKAWRGHPGGQLLEVLAHGIDEHGLARAHHVVADPLLLVQAVALGRVDAEVCPEIGHALGLGEFGHLRFVNHLSNLLSVPSIANGDAGAVRIPVRIIPKGMLHFEAKWCANFSDTPLLTCDFVVFRGGVRKSVFLRVLFPLFHARLPWRHSSLFQLGRQSWPSCHRISPRDFAWVFGTKRGTTQKTFRPPKARSFVFVPGTKQAGLQVADILAEGVNSPFRPLFIHFEEGIMASGFIPARFRRSEVVCCDHDWKNRCWGGLILNQGAPYFRYFSKNAFSFSNGMISI